MPQLFVVGKRVLAFGLVDGLDMRGRRGTIKVIVAARDRLPVGVEFDTPFPAGHSCTYNGVHYSLSGRGRWANYEDLCLENNRYGHVFRVGDRVKKISNAGPFNPRPSLPCNATGTIFWAGNRPGHYPHICVLLDEKYSNVRPLLGQQAESMTVDFYKIPAERWADMETRKRFHIAPLEHFKYVGRRINPAKIYEYK